MLRAFFNCLRFAFRRRRPPPGALLAAACLLACTAPAQTNFALLASDGAWTWYNDPRALFHNGSLYFGSVRFADGKSVLNVFNPRTGQTSNLWAATRTERDDHDVPALLPEHDGTLLAIYARHARDQFFAFRRSLTTNPITAADWGAEQTIPATGASLTYANPFQLSAEGGRIYNFARNLNFNPTLFTSTNGGASWSPPQLFLQTGRGGAIRPYVKYSSDGARRIDFLYTDGHPRDVRQFPLPSLLPGRQLLQNRRRTGAQPRRPAHSPRRRRARLGHLPIQQRAANRSRPVDSHRARLVLGNRLASPTAAPVCVFSVQRHRVAGPVKGADDRIYYYYARWTGATWQKRFIAHAGRPLYPAEDDYAGGICLDPQDPRTIYISSNAGEPFPSCRHRQRSPAGSAAL